MIKKTEYLLHATFLLLKTRMLSKIILIGTPEYKKTENIKYLILFS